MDTVTAEELKNRTGEVLRRVGSGETVTVTVRGVPRDQSER
jgi:prevent-host-death family protein